MNRRTQAKKSKEEQWRVRVLTESLKQSGEFN